MASRGLDFYHRAERRIGRLTLALGFAAAGIVAMAFSPRSGLGVAVGTVLAWISSLWLQQSLDSLTRVAVAQHQRVERAQAVRFPLSVALKFAGRYALIAVVLYVMVNYGVPLLSVLAGLFALGAAAMVEGVYEAVSRNS